MPDPEPNLTLDLTEVDTKVATEIKQVLNDRFTKEICDIKSDVITHSSHFLKSLIWLEGFAFLILLCLSSFIGYQQWQQSQQINQLLKQITPINQTIPPSK